jgi:hypothetical protein
VRLASWPSASPPARRVEAPPENLMSTVNLDALIPREDFEYQAEGIDARKKETMPITDLEASAYFYLALRKPDFQRETAEWDPKRVVGLIRSFIDGDLAPSVILWKNRELLYVIDGSHRLSALIAWVQDDYGDGDLSQEFFDHAITDEQLAVAERTRELVEEEFGSYSDHKDAIAHPERHGPEIVARARRFGSLALDLQWVTGDSVKAENSFIRINQQAAVITPQELVLIRKRKKANVIAARAIKRRATGHKYWAFEQPIQSQIEDMARELHAMFFEPTLNYPIKSLDMPAGGQVHAATSLGMLYEFINMCVGTPSDHDDKDGTRTADYLSRCRRVMRMILSNHPSSLGLHPAVYFYSWTGKQQPILFQTVARMVMDLERTNKIDRFIDSRARFESFLMSNRPLINQLVRKFGTKSSGRDHLREFYDEVLAGVAAGRDGAAIIAELRKNPAFAYLQPDESPYEGVSPTRYSTFNPSEIRAGHARIAANGAALRRVQRANAVAGDERRPHKGRRGRRPLN